MKKDLRQKKRIKRYEIARRKSYILARGWHLRWENQVHSGEPVLGAVPILERFLPN